MPPQVTETEFTCKLITIRTEKSFTEVTGALESLFEPVNLQKLADMTAAGDKAASSPISKSSPPTTNSRSSSNWTKAQLSGLPACRSTAGSI